MPRRAVGIAPMTSAERQARRRKQFRNMREALAEIERTATAGRPAPSRR